VVIFIVIPLLFFLAFVVGGKDLIESVLCRKYVIKEYRQGDIVSFDSITGEVEKIDLVSTTLKSGDKEILVPNVELARKIVKRQRRR